MPTNTNSTIPGVQTAPNAILFNLGGGKTLAISCEAGMQVTGEISLSLSIGKVGEVKIGGQAVLPTNCTQTTTFPDGSVMVQDPNGTIRTYDKNHNLISTSHASTDETQKIGQTDIDDGVIVVADAGDSGGDDGGDYGGGGGGGCVAIASWLPDGRHAGDVEVGDTLQLAHESSLEPAVGEVSYSQRKTQPGFRIVTQSGVSLVCSSTAPIPTPEGLVLAPDLLGKKVPTRRDTADGSFSTAWEMVESVESVGPIEVQHITVGDRCFWAGETQGVYILHHNLKDSGGDDPGDGDDPWDDGDGLVASKPAPHRMGKAAESLSSNPHGAAHHVEQLSASLTHAMASFTHGESGLHAGQAHESGLGKGIQILTPQ